LQIPLKEGIRGETRGDRGEREDDFPYNFNIIFKKASSRGEYN
jgi:hypothetical protein